MLEYGKFSFNSISSKRLVILVGMLWSTFILLCPNSGIEISGSNSSKRHLLNTTDYQLITFLNLIYLDRIKVRELLY
jgi:hypothetical protein